ncbi:MAG: hypothetical protein JSV84_14305 [Gemmatimonadota bacterium]|nr:MAG: hypothetical protein JSV84_14305 [Gemmatimonadota bacterium]
MRSAQSTTGQYLETNPFLAVCGLIVLEARLENTDVQWDFAFFTRNHLFQH